MGYDTNPNGSDFTIVTDVLQYSVFASVVDTQLRSIQKLPIIERIIPMPINTISKLYKSPGSGPSIL